MSLFPVKMINETPRTETKSMPFTTLQICTHSLPQVWKPQNELRLYQTAVCMHVNYFIFMARLHIYN